MFSSSQRPTYSHQLGLQNKSCFHVRRLTSGLFRENRNELDEVVSHSVCLFLPSTAHVDAKNRFIHQKFDNDLLKSVDKDLASIWLAFGHNAQAPEPLLFGLVALGESETFCSDVSNLLFSGYISFHFALSKIERYRRGYHSIYRTVLSKNTFSTNTIATSRGKKLSTTPKHIL